MRFMSIRAIGLVALMAILLIVSLCQRLSQPRAQELPDNPDENLSVPILAVEDTFRMPTTTLPEHVVEADRVTLDEILRHCVGPQADSSNSEREGK